MVLHPNYFGIGLTDAFNKMLPHVRLEILRDFKDTEQYKEVACGLNFNSAHRVLWTLRSAYTADEFRKNQTAAIYDALLDCAKRDYWYLNEKEF
jgi:hypothetical protein